jgi:hypothetical protein
MDKLLNLSEQEAGRGLMSLRERGWKVQEGVCKMPCLPGEAKGPTGSQKWQEGMLPL